MIFISINFVKKIRLMRKQAFGIVVALLVSILLISGKPSDTDKLWKLYNKYQQEDLPQKADAILDKIIDISKANRLMPDLLKAYGERINTYNWLYDKDEFYAKYSAFLEKELESQKNDTLVAGFIHFYLVNVYADALKHFSPGIWEYDETPEEMRFWPVKQFSDKIFSNTKYILDNAAYFININTQKLSKVILQSDYEYYPSLFDIFTNKISNTLVSSLLNSRFSTYFDNSLIANDTLIASYDLFKHLKITASENNVASFIVKLYQTDLDFAAQSTGCKRFAQVEYDRLSLFSSISSLKNKQKKFIGILKSYLDKYKNAPCEIIYAYYLANAYYNSGYKNSRVKALEIAERYYKKYPKNLFAENLKSLAKEIKDKKQLDISIKNHIVPGRELLATIDYLNVQQIKITSYRISVTDYIKLANYYGDEKNELSQDIIKKRTPVANLTFTLPATSDYFPKTTNILIPPMKKGFYLIKFESDSISNYLTIQVNDISAVRFDENNALLRFYRKSNGSPLKKLKITEVSFNNRSNKVKFSEANQSDVYSKSENYFSYLLVVNNKDSAIFSTPYLYDYQNKPRKQTRSFIYTDRLTYRPGEKIMFAAVRVEGYKGKKKVLTSEEQADVALSSSFGKTLWKTRITPDKNGVIHGEYVLPENLQPGNYILRIAEGSKRIKVEAYKLPKYKLDFDLSQKAKALGDTIEVAGKITTYSGMPVNGTKVVYSVWKKSWPGIKYFWSYYFSPSRYFVKTDTIQAMADGSFNFSFPTEKDTANITYEVTVRTILPSGETEEKTKTFTIRPFPYDFHAITPDIIVSDWNNTISIKKDLNGETAKFPVKLTLYELKSPPAPWLENKLDADTIIYTQEQWYKKTKLYPYPGQKPQILRKVLSTTIESDTFELPNSIKPGYYKVVLEKEFKGETRKTTKTFFVTTSNSTKTFGLSPLHMAIRDTKPVKGCEVKEILLNSAANGMEVNVYLYDGKKLINSSVLKLKGKQVLYKINIPDTVQYNISAVFISYFNGKLIKNSFTLKKYRPSINLQITHINDKTMPGKQERITIKVTDDKNNPAKATLIAGMTDLALEKFGKNYWERTFGCYSPSVYIVEQPQKNDLSSYFWFPQVYRTNFTPRTGTITGYTHIKQFFPRNIRSTIVKSYSHSLVESAEQPVEAAKGI